MSPRVAFTEHVTHGVFHSTAEYVGGDYDLDDE